MKKLSIKEMQSIKGGNTSTADPDYIGAGSVVTTGEGSSTTSTVSVEQE